MYIIVSSKYRSREAPCHPCHGISYIQGCVMNNLCLYHTIYTCIIGKDETEPEKLRSILAQLDYHHQVNYWHAQAVPFKNHLYVPEREHKEPSANIRLIRSLDTTFLKKLKEKIAKDTSGHGVAPLAELMHQHSACLKIVYKYEVIGGQHTLTARSDLHKIPAVQPHSWRHSTTIIGRDLCTQNYTLKLCELFVCIPYIIR